MKKTIGFAVICSSLIIAGQAMAFGGGSGGGGPRSNYPDYGQGGYGQQPAYGNPGSGGGFGGGPGGNYPDHNRGYGPGSNASPGAGFGSAPRGQQPGAGYGGYQQGSPGGYNANPYSSGEDEYDIPRDNKGQQYSPGQGGQGYGGYPQRPGPGYYGQPGHYPPPPGYRDDYRRDRRRDNDSSGFNPMNMMKNPMKSGPMSNMFGGDKD